MELPVVLRRDVAGHSLLEETCKGFRTCARSAGCVLRSVVTGGDGVGILAADFGRQCLLWCSWASIYVVFVVFDVRIIGML